MKLFITNTQFHINQLVLISITYIEPVHVALLLLSVSNNIPYQYSLVINIVSRNKDDDRKVHFQVQIRHCYIDKRFTYTHTLTSDFKKCHHNY